MSTKFFTNEEGRTLPEIIISESFV